MLGNNPYQILFELIHKTFCLLGYHKVHKYEKEYILLNKSWNEFKYDIKKQNDNISEWRISDTGYCLRCNFKIRKNKKIVNG